MQFHPVANIFPMMQPDEYEALVEDIRTNGLLEPIWTHEGLIIDGRNRWRACQEAGVAPTFREWSGQGSLVAFVVALNLKRRHLSSSQKAALAVEVDKQLGFEARERQRLAGQMFGEKHSKEELFPNLGKALEPIHATREAAKVVGVSHGYVSDAKRLERDSPDLLNKVREGTLTISQAKQELKQEQQRETKERAVVAHSDTLALVSSPVSPFADPIALWQNQIFTGDARDVLPKVPQECIDLVLTDPPYNVGFAAYDLHDDSMSAEEYIALLKMLQGFKRVVVIQYPEETMRFVVPALGAPDHVGAWCYNLNTPRRFRLISYYGLKPDYSRIRQPYKNLDDKRIRARLENGAEGSPLYEWWDDIQIVKNVSQEKGNHPCPVPVRLMERIILLSTEQGDTVLDPFIGEGTTAVAAQRNGRNYIGIELSPNYAEAGRERLQAIQPQLTGD